MGALDAEILELTARTYFLSLAPIVNDHTACSVHTNGNCIRRAIRMADGWLASLLPQHALFPSPVLGLREAFF